MEKRNFLHRILGLVEHELEATLAVLILLAAVIGYTLAGTTTAVQSLSPLSVQAAGFSIGSATYQTISFDSALYGTGIYRVRNVSIPSDAPQDVVTLKNKGLTGASPEENYTAKVVLSSPYTGSAYVWGTGDVTLNGHSIANSTTPVSISDETLTIEFTGSSTVQAISVNAKSASQTQQVSNVFVLPNTISMTTGEARTFIALVTDKDGKSIANPGVAWSMVATPSGIATINSTTGEVTATAAGKLIVTARVNSASASATVTILAKTVTEVPAKTPATTPEDDTTNTVKPPVVISPVDNSTETPGTATPTTEDNTTDGATPTRAWYQFIPPLPENATVPQVVTKLFSPEMVIARAEATGTVTPSAQEVQAATKSMTFMQKVVANVEIGLKQMSTEIKTMVSGMKVTDNTGKIIIEKKSLGQSIRDLVKSITSGASASPTRAIIHGGDDESD